MSSVARDIKHSLIGGGLHYLFASLRVQSKTGAFYLLRSALSPSHTLSPTHTEWVNTWGRKDGSLSQMWRREWGSLQGQWGLNSQNIEEDPGWAAHGILEVWFRNLKGYHQFGPLNLSIWLWDKNEDKNTGETFLEQLAIKGVPEYSIVKLK